MQVEDYSVLTVAYEMRAGNHRGKVVEKLSAEKPLKFVFGVGSMLPDFEVNLQGKEVGDAFDFVVHCDRGYGRFKKDSVVNVPKSIFVIDGRLAEELMVVGTVIPITLEGKSMKGRILEISESKVRLDFNHPLAGHHLHFHGQILDMRMATREEVAQKKVLE